MRDQRNGQREGPVSASTTRFSKPVEQRRREVVLGLTVVGVLGAHEWAVGDSVRANGRLSF